MVINLKKTISNKKNIYQVTIVSIAVNIFLAVLKVISGLITKSNVMISDGVHSLSDVFATLVVIIGIKISRKKPDKKHQYGHERYECITSILLSVIIFLTGLFIGYNGIITIIKKNYITMTIPGFELIFISLICIITKELTFKYIKNIAQKNNSSALMADAWHHRADELSSIGVFIGIFGSIIGIKILEPISCIAIALLIMKSAVDIWHDSVDKMVDCSVSEEVEKNIRNIINNQKDVHKIDDLKTRLFGSKIYIDLEISVDSNISLKKAHQIAHNVHDEVEAKIKECKHCMIHVNPDIEKSSN